MLTFNSFHLPSLILSLSLWISLYFILRHLQPHRKAEWHCRIVTAVHAVLITVITGWAAFIQGPWVFTDAGGPNTPLQIMAITICLGYFLFDFAWCLFFQTEGLTMLLHHTLSIVGLMWTLLAGKYGTEMVATICGSEVTNPLLQLRWFLKETRRHSSLVGEIVDLTFMASFLIVRIGVGSVLIYCYFQQETDVIGRFGAVCIYLISWVFWISIFRYALYKYSKRFHAWQSQHQHLDRDAATGGLVLASAPDSSGNGSTSTATSLSVDTTAADAQPKECRESMKGVAETSVIASRVILPSIESLAKNGVHNRLTRGLTHSSSAVMDQLGLTG